MSNMILGVGLLLLTACHTFGESSMFVASGGDDGWSGKRATPSEPRTDGPFATLERARAEIRKMKQVGLSEGRVTLKLRAGIYQLPPTFVLTRRGFRYPSFAHHLSGIQKIAGTPYWREGDQDFQSGDRYDRL